MTDSGPLGRELPGDLHVEPVSGALSGYALDVVVAGSIGAVESIRFIRALRRLGASVRPWLTTGGAQFVTPMALAWAAGCEVRQVFTGDAAHIAVSDACIVAPASASLLGRLAHGLTDTPASALLTSALGSAKPVLCLPNMHDSLLAAPAVQANLRALIAMGVQLLPSREEEGKQKFPTPAALADQVAHRLNKQRNWAGASPQNAPKVLITMGSTRGYVDDVRYFSNYSSGALGSHIAEELYRLGCDTHVVAGPSPLRPQVYGSLHEVATNAEMAAASAKAMSEGANAAVLAASVLDFIPAQATKGKISSADHERLTIELVRAPKIIADIRPASGIKVGFKLETGLTEAKARALATSNISNYGLSLMVLNDLADVDHRRHTAFVVTPASDSATELHFERLSGKRQVAQAVAVHVASRLKALSSL